MRYFRLSLAALLLALPAAVMITPTPASASSSQVSAQQVTLNPGGGILADGTDGLRFTINSAAGSGNPNAAIAGQDGVVYRNTYQYCCTAGAPMLNVGGTLYGQAGPAYSSTTWNSLQIMATSGTASTGTRTSAVGSASATVRYTAIKSARTYLVDRTVSYTYPNDYVTDTYTFTIHDGNTDTVKFYLGGDTAPGSSDQGYGVMLTSPVRSVISLNTSSHIMFGFREVLGSKIFDGATSQQYNVPYATVANGGNIGYVGTASNHDAGLVMQWNLGSTPGTQTASLEQFSTQQGTNLNASFAAGTTETGSPVNLNFSIVNTQLSTTSSLAYTANLPSGLVIGAGTPANGCSGTLTATTGSSSIALAGGSVGATTNCVISVPVVSNVASTYPISASSVSGLSSLTNNVGTSSLIVKADNDGDGITNAVEAAAPNTGDANNDGTPDKNQLNVTSFSNAVSGEYTTVAADNACDLTTVSVHAASTSTPDAGYAYPLGLLNFTANCGTPGYTTTITQYFYDPPAGNFVLRKLVGGSYQTVSGASMSTTTIGGHSVLRVSYQVKDGGPLDDDGAANGIIVDPAGPAVLGASTAGVPNTGLGQHSPLLPAAAGFAGLGLLAVAIRSRRPHHAAHF